MLTIHDSMARAKRAFAPIDPNDVRMYVCGPTVYDRAHLGNARPVVVFDVLFRLLRHLYGEENVRYVRNVTDVDDKINARAAETGRPIREITEETLGWFHEDMQSSKGLGALPPTEEPRATDYITQMVQMIEVLIGRGFAYQDEKTEGHVLFDVSKYDAYGKLSGRSLDDMVAGARVEVAPYKRDPMDFVLWKPAGQDEQGWDSNLGRGRPGWHIECSAMSAALLGERFDIHGGGQDLKFPHHENEIAQSECAHSGGGFANYWMHNEMLLVEGRKMSKSLGNFFTVRDLLDKGVPGAIVRIMLLSMHYRRPMDWTEDRLRDAERRLSLWSPIAEAAQSGTPHPDVISALSDDLNTSLAMTIIDRLAREHDWDHVAGSLELMGFEPQNSEDFWVIGGPPSFGSEELYNKYTSDWLRAWENARREKDYDTADAIRDKLRAVGISIRATPTGPEAERLSSFDPEALKSLE